MDGSGCNVRAAPPICTTTEPVPFWADPPSISLLKGFTQPAKTNIPAKKAAAALANIRFIVFSSIQLNSIQLR
jgi:hypothetical protein